MLASLALQNVAIDRLGAKIGAQDRFELLVITTLTTSEQIYVATVAFGVGVDGGVTF